MRRNFVAISTLVAVASCSPSAVRALTPPDIPSWAAKPLGTRENPYGLVKNWYDACAPESKVADIATYLEAVHPDYPDANLEIQEQWRSELDIERPPSLPLSSLSLDLWTSLMAFTDRHPKTLPKDEFEKQADFELRLQKYRAETELEYQRMREDLIAQSRRSFWYVAERHPASVSTNASDAFWYDAEAERFGFEPESVFLCDEFMDPSGRYEYMVEMCLTGPERILCEPESGNGLQFVESPSLDPVASDNGSRPIGRSLLEICSPKALASMRPKIPVEKARELAPKLAGVVEFEVDIESTIPPKYFVEDADFNFRTDYKAGRLKSMEVRNVCTGERIGAPDPAP